MLRLVVIVVCIAALLTGCTLPYYAQAVGGQIGLLRKRVPIDEVIGDATYDAEVKRRLARVVELRHFAVERLLLPDNDSYSSYVDLGRPYVVWNVVATDPFSVDPIRWCFPIAGCVSYRGYFDRERAEAYRSKLAADGLDTYGGGSGAYSTLGYFADPVLNTMLRGSDAELAGVLFHELAHQRVYVKDDSELSEAYATAVEEYGVELWLGEHDRGLLDAYRLQRRRREELGRLVAFARDDLRALYASSQSDETMQSAKAEVFGEVRQRYGALKQSWNGYAGFDGWFQGELNNATLVAISTYRRWLPGLRRRLEAIGIEAFHDEVAALAELDDDARAQALEDLNALASLAQVH